MNVHSIYRLQNFGLHLGLTPRLQLVVKPRSKITPLLRQWLQKNTQAVISLINISAANDPRFDSDRWCWPHSSAMNTAEIANFNARLHHFSSRGAYDAEALADCLVARDRNADSRRMCFECSHYHVGGDCSQGLTVSVGLHRCHRFHCHGAVHPLPTNIVIEPFQVDSPKAGEV